MCQLYAATWKIYKHSGFKWVTAGPPTENSGPVPVQNVFTSINIILFLAGVDGSFTDASCLLASNFCSDRSILLLFDFLN